MNRAETGKRRSSQTHPDCQTDASNKPHRNASANLNGPPVWKARPKPVQEPKLHPMASERRPKHQKSGRGPASQASQPLSQNSAKDQRDNAGTEYCRAMRLAIGLPL
jgi:hypothetical protein